MYPTDFEADTSHLTLAEDGAYNRLLRLMWMTPGCSLPDDADWIRRRMRCQSDADFETVMTVVGEFFTRKSGRIISPRLAKEHQKTDLAHRKRVEAGSMGGKAKAAKSNNKSSSNAKAMLYQPEPEPEPYKREAKASIKSGDNDAEIIQILSIAVSPNIAAAFVQHRKELKKPMTANAASAMIKKLEGHPAPDDVLTDSIANGWQGIFPEKTKGKTNGHSKQTSRADFDTAHREYTRRVGKGEIDFGPDPSNPFGG